MRFLILSVLVAFAVAAPTPQFFPIPYSAYLPLPTISTGDLQAAAINTKTFFEDQAQLAVDQARLASDLAREEAENKKFAEELKKLEDETPKAEEIKDEEPKAEELKDEEIKADEPKIEESKIEEPKTEEPKMEMMKSALPEEAIEPAKEIKKPIIAQPILPLGYPTFYSALPYYQAAIPAPYFNPFINQWYK